MADLDGYINRATNPNNVYEDWKAIVALCDYLNKDGSAIPNAVRLLSHKMQSPQEKEALYALRTLEACSQRCGAKFHTEIGKFRFLNEMIKMLSPKYLGSRINDNVKRRVVEIMRTWSTQLKGEGKIAEAFAMLQRNGFIREAATDDKAAASRGSTDSNKKKLPSVFEDDDKSKTLAALLKSRNPADLIAANRLIKTMLKEDAEMQDRLVKRDVELETVANNVKLLSEMLNTFESDPDRSQTSELEIVKELEATLQRSRPQLVKLASETDERDTETVSLICKLGDDVTSALSRCSSVLGSQLLENVVFNQNPSTQSAAAPASGGNDLFSLGADFTSLSLGSSTAAASGPADVNLLDIDFGFSSQPTGSSLNGSGAQPLSPSTNALLGDVFRGASTPSAPTLPSVGGDLLGLSPAQPPPPPGPAGFVLPQRACGYASLAAMRTGGAPPPQPSPPVRAPQPAASPFAELEFLQKTSLSKPQQPSAGAAAPASNDQKLLLLDDMLDIQPAAQTPAPAPIVPEPRKRTVVSETRYLEYSDRSGAATRPCASTELLPALRIEVSDVVPSTAASKCLLDVESVRLMLHFTENQPEPSGSRLLVLALSSFSTSRVSNIELSCSTLVRLERETDAETGADLVGSDCTCAFQCASFRLIAMSGVRELAAFNPLVPPATVTFALHVARASDTRCGACQRDHDAPFGRCLKLRVAFEMQSKRFDQLVHLADFM